MSKNTKYPGDALQLSEIVGAVHRRIGELKACYEGTLRGLGAFDARFRLWVLIAPNESVIDIRIAESNLPASLRCCIERSVRAWSFPAAGSESMFSQSIGLRTDAAPALQSNHRDRRP